MELPTAPSCAQNTDYKKKFKDMVGCVPSTLISEQMLNNVLEKRLPFFNVSDDVDSTSAIVSSIARFKAALETEPSSSPPALLAAANLGTAIQSSLTSSEALGSDVCFDAAQRAEVGVRR